MVSVAIPTYNRAALLRQTLAGLMRQDYPPERLEILVIDNNSPDGTRAVVELFIETESANAHPDAPTLRYVHEPKQGLDHARNRAIAEARGELLILADDDILMEPSWVRELCAPLLADLRGTTSVPAVLPRIGCVGGEVVPVFLDGCPEWQRDWHRPLSFRSEAQGAGPIPPSQSPMGANFAFPRRVFERVGGFALGLDRRGASLFSGGDAEMVRRIRAAGYAVWFAPAARVRHQMPAARTTFRYAARHAFGSARSSVADHVINDGATCYLLSRFAVNLIKAALYALSALLYLFAMRPGSAKKALVRAWRSCGYLYQVPRSLLGRI